MIKLLGILVITIGGVISFPFFQPTPHVDSELQYAYDDWRQECKQRDINPNRNVRNIDSIIFGSLGMGFWGKCFKEERKIIINSKMINPEDTFLIKLIVYHELGHCAFDYRHDNTFFGIMNATLPEEKLPVYKYFWDYLVDDFFLKYQTPRTRKRLGVGKTCTCENARSNIDIDDMVLKAIMYVESRGNNNAHCFKEDAVGCLQIRPIMVRDINRILKLQGSQEVYQLEDRWDVSKSIQMFNIYCKHYNLNTPEEKARCWNGGPKGIYKATTLKYWYRVKNKLVELTQ